MLVAGLDLRIPTQGRVGFLEFLQRRNDRLRHEPPAVGPEIAPPRYCADSHRRTCSINFRIFSGSFCPSVSTPLLTSTPKGRTISSACVTFSGVRPPDRIKANRSLMPLARFQSKARPLPPASPSTLVSSINAEAAR